MEQHVVVSIDVSVGGTPGASAACRSFQRMGLQHPVADINHANVLLHDDVAGKSAVVHPIAKAPLDRSGIRPSWAVQVSGKIVPFTANDFTQRLAVNARHPFHERRAITTLEAP